MFKHLEALLAAIAALLIVQGAATLEVEWPAWVAGGVLLAVWTWLFAEVDGPPGRLDGDDE